MTSVVYHKGCSILRESNIFQACVDEMHQQCPLFLEVLSCALGNADPLEKKTATIATIYGMVMHSRNVKASVIQRMYSSIAMRYHADNKAIFLEK